MDFIGIETFTVEDSLDAQVKKVLEEANELFAEIHNRHVYEREAIVSEAIDTVTAVANVLACIHTAQDTVDEAIIDCNARNAERGRLGYVIRCEHGYISNVNFGSKGSLVQFADDSKYALRFDYHENAQLMSDLLFNLGTETVVVPYAANA